MGEVVKLESIIGKETTKKRIIQSVKKKENRKTKPYGCICF
jgi:hypothetical protein